MAYMDEMIIGLELESSNLSCQWVLENDIVMSSSLFMLITYYSALRDTNEHD